MVQINRIKRHSPQEGKNKWLILVFCSSLLLQFPGQSGMGRRWSVVLSKVFSELAL
jgi:hypothetical protein